jgi:anti-anti-sigma factor
MTEQTAARYPRPEAQEILKLGQLTVHSEREGDIHTICLAGELDLATVPTVERELKDVEATDALSIVVDLGDLEFIDSTGVRMLLSAHARSLADADRLVLLPGPAPVQRVFEISGVDERLPFPA